MKQTTPEMDAKERRILLVTCFGHFISHFNMLVFPALLLPLADRLNMDMADVLGISFWMYLLFGITALPWGMAADRWGATVFLLIFYLGAGLSGLLAAFWIDSPPLLAICLAGIGLFSGIYHPAGLGWISKEIKRVSLGMAYNGMFGNLGLATAPLLAGIVNWLWGPRAVYIALGILNLLGVGLIFISPKSESVYLTNTEPDKENDESLKSFLILLAAMMLGGIAYRGATVIMPAYFELKNQGIFQWILSFTGGDLSKNVVATSVTSFIYIIGMIGQYSGGRTAEKFDLRFSYIVYHLIAVPAAFFMCMAADLPLVALAMIYFFFLLGMQPIENTLVARFTPKKFHHAAYGTKFVLTFGVGSLAVKMVGAIKVHKGIEAVFPALSLISLMLVGVILVLIYNTPRMQGSSE
ncbi:MAG: MFS transporter [Desulfobacterales bacterium]|nr:MFS transporter [Desulfobacterales bacterium]